MYEPKQSEFLFGSEFCWYPINFCGDFMGNYSIKIKTTFLPPYIASPTIDYSLFYARDEVGGEKTIASYITSDRYGKYWIRQADTTSEVYTGPTTNLLDGYQHTVEAKYETNSVIVNVDGSDGSEDTSVTPVSGLTVLRVGENQHQGRQLNGIINKIEIWMEND